MPPRKRNGLFEKPGFVNTEGQRFTEGDWYIRTDKVLNILKMWTDKDSWIEVIRPKQIEEISKGRSPMEYIILTKEGIKEKIILDNIRHATPEEVKKEKMKARFRRSSI